MKRKGMKYSWLTTFAFFFFLKLVRRVWVRADATLKQLKQAILKAYDDQYAPEEIILFTRDADQETRRVASDKAAQKLRLSTQKRKRKKKELKRGEEKGNPHILTRSKKITPLSREPMVSNSYFLPFPSFSVFFFYFFF